MLFTGGPLGTAGLFLLGLSATALVSLLSVLGTQSRPKRLTPPLHVVIFAIYTPLLAVAINELPQSFIGARRGAWLVLFLALATCVTSHRLAIVNRSSGSPGPFRKDLELLRHQPPARTHAAYVLTNPSVAAYRHAVLSIEATGRDFAYIQRRIAPYFNSDAILRSIASQRFGSGNPEAEAYILAHRRRQEAFFAALASGARYREMMPRSALLQYVKTGTHAGDMWPLPPFAMVELLQNWRQALIEHANYYVGISDEPLPIKYHVVDNECVILHEPVGRGDAIRLNSIFIYGQDVATLVTKDFELVWGLIDPEWRDRHRIARWVDEELIPLAQERLTSTTHR